MAIAALPWKPAGRKLVLEPSGAVAGAWFHQNTYIPKVDTTLSCPTRRKSIKSRIVLFLSSLQPNLIVQKNGF